MILLTGATGFVGKAVLATLIESQPVRVALRQPGTTGLPAGADIVRACLLQSQNWNAALSGISTVIHCAARVHVMNEDVANPLTEFRRVNVDGTLRLGGLAAEAGVRRFVFVSSIKVNGEYSLPGHPFLADQKPAPSEPYGVSKCEAEAGLRAISQETGMEVVIIRPPLVYGPGVKANFLAMMRWLQLGVPLPLGGITENRRSFVFLDNLVDLIITCSTHPEAANQTFLVSDGEDLSTASLLRRMAAAIGRPARLVSVPMGLITFSARLSGHPDIAQRLCGSLQVDIAKTRDFLGWKPPITVDEGLRATAMHWLAAEWKGNNAMRSTGKIGRN